LILNLSASPFHAGKLAQRQATLRRFAERTGAFLCYCNLVGGQDELVFDGGSLILDPEGVTLAAANRFAEDLLVLDLDIPEKTGPPRGKATETLEPPIILERQISKDRPTIPPRKVVDLNPFEEVYEALALGTRDYVRKNGFEKVVLGLSGGVDSALTAAIAVEAIGKENVIVVSMPSRYSSSETRTDAERVAANLGIRLLTIPIQKVFEEYLKELEGPFGNGDPGIERENLQARIRGNILMALSNRFGSLVLTTGNKSETAVGYSTLYGDTAGGFAVIKDVFKTVVYDLAEYVNAKARKELIPRSVLRRAPTAELRPNQKDEDSLPPYAVLDPILRAYVEEDKALDEIVALGFPEDTVKDVVRLVDRSEFKRRQGPPGVKITPKAFGRDRRIPITNRYGSTQTG
jgi:NAD+ synthase (glutamine-hydrolysing)